MVLGRISGDVKQRDFERSHVRVQCRLCASSRSRIVCSTDDLDGQRRFLEEFHRRRWAKHTVATATDRLSLTQSSSTAIVACLDCGLLYHNPRPNAVGEAYATEHYDGTYLWAEFEAQRTWAHTKISILAKHLDTRARKRRPRILEIGSFVGGFLAEGQARGWDMLGIDQGRDVTAFCRGRQLPVFDGTLEEITLGHGSFDAVVVWNTFDQLPDPHMLLRRAAPLLQDGGLLVVRVPNGACFDWTMTLRASLPSSMTGPLHLALAWNNLLTFPYIHGYSFGQLVPLMASYGFTLRACLPDQVASTPAGQLSWWATLEEQSVKSLWRAGTTVWQDDQYRSAPWLDLYFERACAETINLGTATAALGILPVYSPLAVNNTGPVTAGKEVCQ
jgi:SAM-dependent methyltransferase